MNYRRDIVEMINNAVHSYYRGTFHVKGYSPDGDSIRFMAHEAANWQKLSGVPVKINARSHAQLRFEAIDALETHYENYHQPLKFAEAAQNFLLENLAYKRCRMEISPTAISLRPMMEQMGSS